MPNWVRRRTKAAVQRWTERWSLRLYGVLTRALQAWLPRRLARRARQEPLYAQDMAQRWGDYRGVRAQPGTVWVHAVSLGETRALALWLPALRQAWPGVRVLLTHTTATGREAGRALLQDGDQQVWLPWDSPSATRAFVAHFQPLMGVLMETEVWPQLVQACGQARVPLLLVNARLNPRSLARAQRLAWLSRPAYAGLAQVLAQTEADAQRLRALGASPVDVVGNLKYEVQVPAATRALATAWPLAASRRPVWLLASSREGEEAMWLQAWQAACAAQPGLAQQVLWLVVPRHPQRFDEVAGLLQSAGLRVGRRSAWTAEAGQDVSGLDVVLGDSLGEMAAYALASELALLGGSFAPLGGQNLIEALACACPVIMGPHTFNFAQASEDALAAGLAARVPDMAAAIAQAQQWQADESGLTARQQQAAPWVASHAGAADRTVAAVLAWRGRLSA
ncbi:MAG: hypothetical protein RIQ97_2899 [Pseudomonadota bacterium]